MTGRHSFKYMQSSMSKLTLNGLKEIYGAGHEIVEPLLR